MTDFDRQLIEKAHKLRRYDYRKIDVIIDLADTPEARAALLDLRWSLYDAIVETI